MESRGSTFFLADGGAARTPVAVHLLGSAPCPTAPLEGGFLPGMFTRAWLREKFDVSFPGADAGGPDMRLFTSTLTPEYQRRALLRLLPLLGLGLLMAAVGGRGLYRAIRRRRPGVGPAPRASGRD